VWFAPWIDVDGGAELGDRAPSDTNCGKNSDGPGLNQRGSG